MQLNLTPEQEQQLAQIAAKSGKNAECLVREAALRLIEGHAKHEIMAAELPILHLGAMKSLHRRDIYYDDVR